MRHAPQARLATLMGPGSRQESGCGTRMSLKAMRLTRSSARQPPHRAPPGRSRRNRLLARLARTRPCQRARVRAAGPRCAARRCAPCSPATRASQRRRRRRRRTAAPGAVVQPPSQPPERQPGQPWWAGFPARSLRQLSAPTEGEAQRRARAARPKNRTNRQQECHVSAPAESGGRVLRGGTRGGEQAALACCMRSGIMTTAAGIVCNLVARRRLRRALTPFRAARPPAAQPGARARAARGAPAAAAVASGVTQACACCMHSSCRLSARAQARGTCLEHADEPFRQCVGSSAQLRVIGPEAARALLHASLGRLQLPLQTQLLLLRSESGPTGAPHASAQRGVAAAVRHGRRAPTATGSATPKQARTRTKLTPSSWRVYPRLRLRST